MPRTILLSVTAVILAACGATSRGTMVITQWGNSWVREVARDGTIIDTRESEDYFYEISPGGAVLQAGGVSGHGDIILSRAGELRIDGVVHARLDDAGRLELSDWPDIALAIRADGALVNGDGTVLAAFDDQGFMYGPAVDDLSSAVAYGDRSARRDLLVLWAGLRNARSARPARPRTTPGAPLEVVRVFGTRRLACDGTFRADGDAASGVHGLIWARDGSPAVGARVTVRLPDYLLAYTTTADASGCYLIADVRPGAARIEIEYQASTATQAIAIDRGGLVQIDASVPGVQSLGHVTAGRW